MIRVTQFCLRDKISETAENRLDHCGSENYLVSRKGSGGLVELAG